MEHAHPVRMGSLTAHKHPLAKAINPTSVCQYFQWSIQSGDGSSFTVQITQQLAQALKIKYFLLSAWHPQSSER